jgi:hypothetical protein
MKSITFLQFNKPFIYGLMLMAMPTLFWVGVFLEQIFGNPIITDGVFVRLDQITSLFSILIMIVMPLTTAILNFNFLRKESMPNRSVSFDHAGNVLLVAYSICTIALILGYLFTENILGKGA